jgi:hypothetical protein
VLLTVKDSTTSGLIIAFILERFIGSHKSKMGRQCNGQSKKEKMINGGQKKKLHRKLTIEQRKSRFKPGRNYIYLGLSIFK